MIMNGLSIANKQPVRYVKMDESMQKLLADCSEHERREKHRPMRSKKIIADRFNDRF